QRVYLSRNGAHLYSVWWFTDRAAFSSLTKYYIRMDVGIGALSARQRAPVAGATALCESCRASVSARTSSTMTTMVRLSFSHTRWHSSLPLGTPRRDSVSMVSAAIALVLRLDVEVMLAAGISTWPRGKRRMKINEWSV